jgi:hypothetical protein
MLFSLAFIPLMAFAQGAISSPSLLNKRGISDDVYNGLVFYFKYASSAYSNSCSSPNGNVFVNKVKYPVGC